LPPLKPERARDEGVQYEADRRKLPNIVGISALVSSEPPPNGKQRRTNAKMIRRRQSEAETCPVSTRSRLLRPSERRGHRRRSRADRHLHNGSTPALHGVNAGRAEAGDDEAGRRHRASGGAPGHRNRSAGRQHQLLRRRNAGRLWTADRRQPRADGQNPRSRPRLHEHLCRRRRHPEERTGRCGDSRTSVAAQPRPLVPGLLLSCACMRFPFRRPASVRPPDGLVLHRILAEQSILLTVPRRAGSMAATR
jgi:hypothetical protein